MLREVFSILNEALPTARSDESMTHVLLYLDLDQFKLVNDTCGHQAGDRPLKQITGILQTRIGTSDTIARLGGDEFGILLQFIQNVTTDRVDRSMVEAITQIGRAMGIKTIAERVETAEVLACLADIRVQRAQGIYVAIRAGRSRARAHHCDA